jgi:calcineurin-like phosphoesterase family protein
MTTWITSDWHLGEDRMSIMSRPFRDCNDNIEQLIMKHNELVSGDHLVYVLGDICYSKAPQYLKHIERFHGKKILIRGNHDNVFTDSELAPYFNDIIPDGQGLELGVEGIPCYLTHYPTQGRIDRFNLCGHIHAAWRYQLNMFNVGVDANHFLPVNLDTIPFHLKAITEFYDDDVWCAYTGANVFHRDTRGKKGSYFKKVTP